MHISKIALHSFHKYLLSIPTVWQAMLLILECILENTVSDITEILLYWEKRDQVNKQAIARHWGKVLQVEKKALWEFRGGEITQSRDED